MHKLTPSVDFNIEGSRSQAQITAQLEKYLQFKKEHMRARDERNSCVLPFNTKNRLCAGLVAYWLYCKCNGEEWEFVDNIEYLLSWDKSKVVPGAKDDPKIENLMNIILFLSIDHNLRQDISQTDLEQSFDLVLHENWRKVKAAEFEGTFVYDQKALSDFLSISVPKNKMVVINNAYHRVGVVFDGDRYSLYDPEAYSGPMSYTNTQDLAKAIFMAQAKFCHSQDYMALNTSIFDLAIDQRADYQVQPHNYQQVTSLYAQLLKDLQYKAEFIRHKDIFDLSMWFKDKTLAKYLINEGIDLNAKSTRNLVPLEVAINAHDCEILYELLANGASPNLPSSDGKSLFEACLKHKNAQALIVLLAFGLECSGAQRSQIAQLGALNSLLVISRALELNAKLLKVPAILNLTYASGAEIINYLRHAKLRLQLGKTIDKLEIHYNGKKFLGMSALNQIIAHCHATTNHDLFDLAQKTEILELLKYNLGCDFDSQADQDLLNTFSEIDAAIKKIDFGKVTEANLVEIAIILEHLQAIATHWASIYPKRVYIALTAAVTKRHIEQSLAAYGITSVYEKIAKLQIQHNEPQRNFLFFSPARETVTPVVSYKEEVAPFLKLKAH